MMLCLPARAGMFQSTPQPRRWGDLVRPEDILSYTIDVSIHSPAKKVGRPDLVGGENISLVVSIHSPAKKVGRQTTSHSILAATQSFNPLPSQEGGETCPPERQ